MNVETPPTSENSTNEISTLIETLVETERRLEELTHGELDSVSSRDGKTFLLQRAQEQLRTSEAARQAAILNALPAHIALLDLQGVIISVNEAWRRFANANLFHSPGHGVGTNYLDVCDRSRGACSCDARQVAVGIRAVLNGTKKSFSIEYPCLAPAEQRWFLLTVTPLAADRLSGAVVMHLNITERRRAESSLRASQANMAAAQRLAHFGSWELDLTSPQDIESNALQWSDEMFRIAGYAPGAVKVSNELFFRLVHPDDREPIRQSIATAIQKRQEYSIVHRLIRPNGEERTVQEIAQIFFDEKTGQPLRVIGTAHDITERDRSEQAVAQVLQRLNEAQRIGQIGDWDWDISTQAITWSPQVFEIVGRDPSLGPPRNYDESAAIYDLASRTLMAEKVNRAIESGEAQNYELMALRPSGERIYVQAMAVPTKDDRGRVVGLRGTIQDITQRKEAEAALKESESRYHSLFENMVEGYAYCRTLFEQDQLRDFTYLEVNGAFERLTGLKDVVGKKVSEIIPGIYEASPELFEVYGRVALTGNPEKCETYLKSLGIWFSVTVYSREREHVVAVFDNITESKRAEAALRASEAEFRALAEAMPQMVWITRPDGWNIYFSQQWMNYTGLSMEESLGHGWNKPFHPEDQQRAWDAWQNATLTKGIYAVECRLRRADGAYRWWLMRGVPQQDSAGNVLKWFGTCTDIHDLKLAEHNSRFNEQRYRSLVDATTAIVWDTPASGEFEADQPRWTAFTGQSFEELRGWGWLNAIHPDDRAETERIWSTAVSNKAIYEVEHRIRNQEGAYRNMMARAVPILAEDGVILQWIGIHTDFTARTHMEHALRESNEKFNQLADHISDVFWITSPDLSAIHYISAGYEAIWGRTMDSLYANPHQWVEAILPEERERVFAIFATLMSEEPEVSIEYRIARPDGSVRWIYDRGFQVRDASGNLIRLTGIASDITERKKAEKTLRLSEDRLRAALSASGTGTYRWDIRTNELAWDDSLDALFGLRPGQTVRSLETFIGTVHPDDRPGVIERCESCAREAADFKMEFRVLWPDGSLHWLDDRGKTYVDANGRSLHMTGACVDITERKRVEAELEKTHRELLEISRKAGMAEVATGVLHNVGNVLNSVNVSATLLVENTKKSKTPYLGKVAELLNAHAADLGVFITTDPKGRQLPGILNQLAEHFAEEQESTIVELESLRKNIGHIKDIVAMQQSYAKVSGVTEIISVTELVEDALRMNAGALQRHRIEVVREYAEVPPVTIEKHKVLQILVNLIRNAKYACDDLDGKDKQMKIRVSQVESAVWIEVIDNGIGIPPENLKRIFNHGFTTRKQGHGFGLHSGALAAKELGGALRVLSEGFGKGANFILELPLVQESRGKWNTSKTTRIPLQPPSSES